MHLVKIDLSHQILLSDLFKKLELPISEYSFSNLYLFRDIHQYQLFFQHELFIKGVMRDGSSFLMPTFPLPQSISLERMREWLQEVDFLFPIPEEWLPSFDSKLFNRTYSEEDSDYLFSIEKMRDYPGRDLSGKRNLVKQLLTQHQIEVKNLETSDISSALEILQEWEDEHESSLEKTDYASCKEALELIGTLQLDGLMCYVDGKAKGFLIGETLAHTYVIHFLKADRSIKGLYQYLYQALAQSLGSHYKFINLEQDLGNSQMRQSKHSYQPDQMLHKWRISLKE